MLLFEHPIFKHIVKYASVSEDRANVDFLQLPDLLRSLALEVQTNCPACGASVSPLRARAKSEQSRIAGTETERRLFYAPTCPTEKNPGCSRTKAAKDHKLEIKRVLEEQRKQRYSTRVVNMRKEPYDVYIGRAGHGFDGYFGNPYAAEHICERCSQLHERPVDTLACFKDYFNERVLKDSAFRERVAALKGKTLGCFCKPKICHGDIIVAYLEAK